MKIGFAYDHIKIINLIYRPKFIPLEFTEQESAMFVGSRGHVQTRTKVTPQFVALTFPRNRGMLTLYFSVIPTFPQHADDDNGICDI